MRAVDRMEWNKTSPILVLLNNANCKPEYRLSDPQYFNPYEDKNSKAKNTSTGNGNGITLTKGNVIAVLAAMFGKEPPQQCLPPA